MPNHIYDSFGNPYAALPSLANTKALQINDRLREKQQRLTPDPVPVVPSLAMSRNLLTGEAAGATDDTNAIDLAQGSAARAAVSTSDALKYTSNKLFGTEFNDRQSTGVLNGDVIDEMVGVSQEYRQNVQADQHKVLENVADGDYLGAAGAALNVGVRTAADSFGTIPEVAAGALVTALSGGAGMPVLLKKIKDGADTVEDIKNAYDKVKTHKEASKLAKLVEKSKNLPAVAAKAAGQASFLTADLTMQQVQAYREKYGEDPSAARTAAMGLGVLATTIWEPAIIGKLMIPNFKKGIVNSGRELVKNITNKSALLNIAKRVGDTAQKVTTAGTAEFAQEYLQTMHEILAVDISPKEADNLTQAIASRIQDKDLRDKVLTGGFLGFGAAGTTRAMIAAPSLAAGTGLDLTKATVKGTVNTAVGATKAAGRGLQKVQNKASLKVLSESDREVIRNNYETRQTVVDEKVAEMEGKIKTVNSASTYEEITADEAVAPFVKDLQGKLGITDEDLADPGKLKQLKDRVVRKYKADQKLLQVELEASNLGAIGKKSLDNVKNTVVDAAVAAVNKVPEEVVRKTIAAAITTKEKAEVALASLKEIRSSTALGIIEAGLNGSSTETKKLVTAARSLELNEIGRVADIVAEKNPDLGKKLTRLYEDVKSSLEKLGQRSTDLVNEETLSPIIKDIADNGTLGKQSAAAAASAINEAMAGKIADKATLAKVKKAVEVYKTSDAYKNKDTKGRISETSMGVLEGRLDNATRRLDREVNQENFDSAVDATTSRAKKAAKSVGAQVDKGLDAARTLSQKARLAYAKRVGPDELAKVQAEIDEENKAPEAAKSTVDRRQKDESTGESKRTETRREKEGDRAAFDKMTEDMTSEEKDRAIAQLRKDRLTNPMSGLPNLIAFNEDAREGDIIIALDMDGLGWHNDNWGHEVTDEILKQLGERIAPFATKEVKLYHRSGDEFAGRARSMEAAQEVAAKMQSVLDNTDITLTGTKTVNGKSSTVEYTKKGLGLSYGIGKTYGEADDQHYVNKAEREASGVRSKKGTQPPGVHEKVIEPGRDDNQSETADPIAPSDELKVKMEALELAIAQSADVVEDFAKKMKGVAKAIKAAGYETVEDLAALATQFPGLVKNEEFYARLEAQFETDVIMREDASIEKRETATVPDNKLVELYEKLTGCKK